MFGRRRPVLILLFVASASATSARPVVGQASATSAVAKSPVAAPPSDWQSRAQERPLDVGSVVTGTLAEGDLVWPERRYLDAWDLVGRAGSTVTVDLLSDDFDAVLYLVSPFQLTWDDDGAGGCNARLQAAFTVDGTYRLLASTLRRDESGSYTIRVSNRPAAPQEASCEHADAEVTAPEPPPIETCLAIRWMEWLAIAAESGGGAHYPELAARERTACEMGLETRSGDTWANGQTAFFRDNWTWPNGQSARFMGNWSYPNGQSAVFRDNWYYPNGQAAFFRGNRYLPDGSPSLPAGVIEYALTRLPQELGIELMSRYRESSGAWATLLLIVMASEASR